jgi:hypothetical protein
VESAGIRTYRKRSGRERWHNRPWSAVRVLVDKAKTHCPRLGTAHPLSFEERELSRYLVTRCAIRKKRKRSVQRQSSAAIARKVF